MEKALFRCNCGSGENYEEREVEVTCFELRDFHVVLFHLSLNQF